MDIIKRDGRKVPFDKWKIVHAIVQAYLDVDGILYEAETANDIADEIEKVSLTRELRVEEIQDMVENFLMRSERKDVAKAYIRYRYKREVARSTENDFINAIREKLDAADVKNQNANVDERSFGGRIGEASSVVTKKLALDYIVSKKARNNHLNNRIYIHDLDAYYTGAHNCLSIPFDDLLANGFNTRQTDVRPAKSINTAFQLVAVIFQLQSLNQFGGVSATHLDWTMVPYVRMSFWKHFKDGLKYICNLENIWDKEFNYIQNHISETPIGIPNITIDGLVCEYPQAMKYAYEMTQRELDQAVEGMYHNLNTLQSRSGN